MVEHVSVRHLAQAMERGDAHVIDVRESYEYVAGHVPGAQHVPMHLVPLRVAELPQDKDLYLICETGNRSFQVGLYLARQGVRSHNVEGGTSAWRWAGGPLATGSAA